MDGGEMPVGALTRLPPPNNRQDPGEAIDRTRNDVELVVASD